MRLVPARSAVDAAVAAADDLMLRVGFGRKRLRLARTRIQRPHGLQCLAFHAKRKGALRARCVWLHGLQCLAFDAKRKGALAVVRASSTARRGRELAAW